MPLTRGRAPFGRRLAAAIAASLALAAAAAPGAVALQPYASGLSLPVEIVFPGDGSGRSFVLEQAGRIRIVRGGQVLAQPFLDIVSRVQSGGEQGLLGLAFHPQYAANGLFFVYYTRPPAAPGDTGNEIVLERYSRSTANADVADPLSGEVLLTIPHPTHTNHNGGKILFGPDGLLYVGVGDGGGAGDPNNAAQNLADLHGKILRLSVGAQPGYTIPGSNPFAGRGDARGEVFAYGLRNPWRFGFDRLTGDLFIGDVGQGAREEVDFIAAGSAGGQNFGWRVYEGTRCNDPLTNCFLAGHVPPILEYPHNQVFGFSITGGYRYRGRAFRELRGHYLYGDFITGRLWAGEPTASGAWSTTEVGISPHLSTFGEDEDGELYVADHSAGTIARIGPPDADGDGMSDTFENAHFGGPTAGDASADGDGDGVRNLYEYQEGLDPAVKDNDVFAVARLFAMQQYRDFVAREGDTRGIAYWAAELEAARTTRKALALAFFDSAEFGGAIAPVARLYFAYFLRIPDYAGLTRWIAQSRAGMPLETISQHFANSFEFFQRYGSLDNGQFVSLVYDNVLGRPPDAAGLAFWRGQLDSGERTRGQVMLAFSESAEYRPVIHNEVYVTMMYVGMLRRSPDPGGFSFWVDQLDRGNPGSALVDGALASAEYRARFLP